ncbi:hypothetical protein ACIP3U_33890 [[Kitasatospora] papulosa]|uniref:hypothetical protein n=1 Tax=[Kitasatospora] papulosa TaxID=1464011 RepID=UPI00382E9696
MGKRETAEEVVRRLGREGFGFLTEAGFTGPHDIDGGVDYAGHGLRITIYHYHWKSGAEVVATVCALGVPVQGSTPDLAEQDLQLGEAAEHAATAARALAAVREL